jgi:hypothetical protein
MKMIKLKLNPPSVPNYHSAQYYSTFLFTSAKLSVIPLQVEHLFAVSANPRIHSKKIQRKYQELTIIS